MQKGWRNFLYAFRGIALAIRRERHMQIHIAITCLVLIAGIYFHITRGEWISISVCIALVLAAELFNTSIEKLGDMVSTEYSDSMRNVKDMAAGAVLITAIIAVVVGCCIFIPYIS